MKKLTLGQEDGVYWGVTLILLAMALWAAWWFAAWKCDRRWADAGIPSRYTIGAGCQVRAGGHWFPDDRLREVLTTNPIPPAGRPDTHP